MSNKIIEGTLAAILVAALVIVVCMLGTLGGAFAGWVISLTPLKHWLYAGFDIFGYDVRGSLWLVGATCGFVGAFFRNANGSN